MNEMNNELHSTPDEIKTFLGDKAWGLVQETTKIGVVTAELCYKTFRDKGISFDFSASVMPIMKCLELELRLRFYDPYLQYLKNTYTPYKYVQTIFKNGYPNNEKAAARRRLILICTNNTLAFQSDPCEFTIGDFRFLIGAYSLKNPKFDEPFIKYCKTELFQGMNVSRERIISWLKQLVLDVESLRELRNNSAHGGITQNSVDAKTALDDLVKVKKVLVHIVDPF